MKLACIIALMASTLHAQLVEVNLPDADGAFRDAIDAAGVHGVEMVRSLPSPLISTDLREALHVESGAVVLNITVPPEAILVREGAVTLVIPVDRAVEALLPFVEQVLLPTLREEAQMLRDDLRTSFGRDSQELVAEIKWWRTPGLVLLAALILLAVCAAFERVTDNRRK